MPRLLVLAALAMLINRSLTGLGSPPDVIDFMADNLDAWQAKTREWTQVGGVQLDPKNPEKLLAQACKAPGEWQTLDVVFHAPRFDKDGKKIKNAMIAKATLNGQVIHEDQELKTPTGDRWQNKEMFEGPLMLQADHGPVAIRNMKV